MIQQETFLNVADNSGAKRIQCIRVLLLRPRRHLAFIGHHKINLATSVADLMGKPVAALTSRKVLGGCFFACTDPAHDQYPPSCAHPVPHDLP